MDSFSYDKSAKLLTAFVGGIPGDITNDQILYYFSQFGTVTRVKVPQKSEFQNFNKGYCFVTFSREEELSRVLRIGNHFIGSRRVTCKQLLVGDKLDHQMRSTNDRKVFIKFIPRWVSEEAFKKYFQQFGEVESYYMVRYRDPQQVNSILQNSSFGYIVYKDKHVSSQLVEKKYLKIGNKKIQVEKYDKEYAKERMMVKEEKRSDIHSLKPTERKYAALRSAISSADEFAEAAPHIYRFNISSPSSPHLILSSYE